MATLATLTTETYNLLYGMPQVERPAEDYLKTALDDANDLTCQFTVPAMWRKGDYAEEIAVGEVIKMREDHPTSGDVNVYRAERGTSAAGGHVIGTRFYRNPLFLRREITEAINQTIDLELWPHVWNDGTASFTHVLEDTFYEVGGNIREISFVYQYDINSNDELWPFPTGWWSFEPDLATGVSSTQRALRIFRVWDPEGTIYYQHRTKPVSSDIANTLGASLAYMVPYGAAARLLDRTLTGTRADPQRNTRRRSGNQQLVDANYLRGEFMRLRKERHRQLSKDLIAIRKHPARVRVG